MNKHKLGNEGLAADLMLPILRKNGENSTFVGLKMMKELKKHEVQGWHRMG